MHIFQNFKKMSERMAQGKQQLNLERNLPNRFRDDCNTDEKTDAPTTDDRGLYYKLC